MTWDEWRFSAKLAWQDQFIRWTLLATTVFVLAMSVFTLWRLIPEGLRAGVITMHYSIYLGIDDVRAWPWVFLFPGAMILVMSVNGFIALGTYRMHAIASRTVIAFSAITSALWGIGLFFIMLMNL